MYVQGVSTRKVIEVLQKLVGPELGISQHAGQPLHGAARRGPAGLAYSPPLDETPYVILDARYERVREAGG
jgi:transposase-like protein